MTERQQLISRLAIEARPIHRPGQFTRPVLVWLLSSVLIVGLLMLLRGELRPSAPAQLLGSVRFSVELLTGLATLVMLSLCIGRSSIPGLPRNSTLLWASLAILLLWLAQAALSVLEPALPVSMLGKREHCWLETLICSLPPLLLGLIWLRRQWVLEGPFSGLLVGLAAGMIPALMMQVFCMYIPAHHVSHHLLPGLLMGIVGAVAGALILRHR